jgi:hypothetical protein
MGAGAPCGAHAICWAWKKRGWGGWGSGDFHGSQWLRIAIAQGRGGRDSIYGSWTRTSAARTCDQSGINGPGRTRGVKQRRPGLILERGKTPRTKFLPRSTRATDVFFFGLADDGASAYGGQRLIPETKSRFFERVERFAIGNAASRMVVV